METRAPPPKERKPHSSKVETRKSKATPAKASKEDEHEARVNCQPGDHDNWSGRKKRELTNSS